VFFFFVFVSWFRKIDDENRARLSGASDERITLGVKYSRWDEILFSSFIKIKN
jgi:hypothetical protein